MNKIQENIKSLLAMSEIIFGIKQEIESLINKQAMGETNELKKYINSLDELGYGMAKVSYKFLYGKELTRQEYQLLVDEKIKRLKSESNDEQT